VKTGRRFGMGEAVLGVGLALKWEQWLRWVGKQQMTWLRNRSKRNVKVGGDLTGGDMVNYVGRVQWTLV
jgi:hypothetical protein